MPGGGDETDRGRAQVCSRASAHVPILAHPGPARAHEGRWGHLHFDRPVSLRPPGSPPSEFPEKTT
eukprot:2326942-Pyramimonas_sp.AAC.1